MTGRKPYTQKQIDSSVCFCCKKPARFQWNACADGNVWRLLCVECDVRVNIGVLKVLYPRGWKTKIRAYCKSIGYKPTEEMMK